MEKNSTFEVEWIKEIESKNFEELVRILASKDDYSPDFIEMVEQKVKTHIDYSEEKVNAIIEQKTQARNKTKEEADQSMSGWLMLFMFGLVVGSFILLYQTLVSISPESYDYNLPLMWCDIITVVGVSILAGYTFVSLLKRWPNAIHLTRFYIGICLVLSVINFLQLASGVNPIEDISFWRVIWGIVVAILWLLYFAYSNRIKARYPVEKRQFFRFDKWFLSAVIAVPLILFIWGMSTTSSVPVSSVAEGMDMDGINQSSYLIDESKLEHNEITDGIIIIKLPEGVEYESLDFGEGVKGFDLNDKKENSDYVIRALGQGYVNPGDINFEELWEQYQDSTMMELPNEVVRNDVMDLNHSKCYRKIVKYESGEVLFWDFSLMYNAETKKVLLLTSYYNESAKAPVDDIINGVRFKQE